MATRVVKFTNQFTDGTTANVEVGPFESVDTSSIKEKVRAVNAELANGATGLSSHLVSKTGAGWKAITTVTVTTTERVYLF